MIHLTYKEAFFIVATIMWGTAFVYIIVLALMDMARRQDAAANEELQRALDTRFMGTEVEKDNDHA